MCEKCKGGVIQKKKSVKEFSKKEIENSMKIVGDIMSDKKSGVVVILEKKSNGKGESYEGLASIKESNKLRSLEAIMRSLEVDPLEVLLVLSRITKDK